MRLPRHYVPRNDRKCFPLTPVSSTGQALTLSLQGRGENMGVWQYTTTRGRGKKGNKGVCYTPLLERKGILK
jgi:hypothetical protein